MPPQFPALLSVTRVVSAQALVSFRGNRYSVPPHLHGATVTVTVRLDGTPLDIATTPSAAGRAAGLPTVIARHRIAPTGAGVMVRDHGHVTALNQAAITAATTEAPHRSKQRRPPTPAARAEAGTLRARTGTGDSDAGRVVDLARYAAAAPGRNTLRTTQPATPPATTTATTSRNETLRATTTGTRQPLR